MKALLVLFTFLLACLTAEAGEVRVFINWGDGGFGSDASLSEDGKFTGDNCSGEFIDVNTIIFSVHYHSSGSDVYYNITGSRK